MASKIVRMMAGLAACCLLAAARPLPPDFMGPPPPQNRIQRPFDLIELIPVLRDINRMIPRNFSLARHKFRVINANRIIIEKKFEDLRCRLRRKNSIVTFSYNGGAGSAGSLMVDVPLFYAESFRPSGWGRYPVGNYTVTLDRSGGSPEDKISMCVQTRF